jgi:hypothetical protein
LGYGDTNVYWLKAKPDKNEMEKGGYKLLKLLVENPHIPLSDLKK